MTLRLCVRHDDGTWEPLELSREAWLAFIVGLAAAVASWLLGPHLWTQQPKAGEASSRSSPPRARRHSSEGMRPRAMSVLREVTSIKGAIIGIDVGGTLAKMVVAEPRTCSKLPAEFGQAAGDGLPSGQTHEDLELVIHRRHHATGRLERVVSGASARASALISGSPPQSPTADETAEDDTCSIQFLSGASSALEAALKEPSSPTRKRPSVRSAEPPASSVLAPSLWGRVSALFGLHAGESGSPCGPEARTPPKRKIACAGGGAHKLRELVLSAFNVELDPVPEMESVIEGLLALHALRPPGALFTVTPDGLPDSCPWPSPSELFPLVLVNIGSGVSVLRVDGFKTDPASGASVLDYRRVGGTACGGATFLGLAKLLTRRPDMSFEEALELAAKGDSAKVDKLVGDIYGVEGSKALGMPHSHTAASFGKLVALSTRSGRPRLSDAHAPASSWPSADEDVVSALLDMVSQASAVLARAHASHHGLSRVFFSGGFVSANPLARAALSRNLRALGTKALFFRHSDFLGAIGALSRSWPGGSEAFRAQWVCAEYNMAEMFMI